MNNLVYTIKLDAKGKLLPELKVVSRQMDDVAKSAKRANGMFSKMQTICSKMTSINFAAWATNVQNAFEGLASFSESGMGFQQSMADLQAITGIVGKDLQEIGKVARETGKSSGLGAKGAVDAFTLLASQIQIDKIGLKGLMQLQKETITLAQAGGLEMADAATAMAATINQFGLKASEANRVINVLAAGSKYGAAEVADLAQSFKVSGATAAAAGLSVEQTAGAIEVLSQMNLKGAEAGTALRNIILKLQTTLGMDLSDVGISRALDSLKPKLQDTAYLAKVFGAENIAAAQYLIANATAVEEMTAALTATNVAQEQAAIRTNTMAEQMKRIQANIDDVKISLFEITGGFSGYVSALGETGVMISQMIPLLSLTKNWMLKLLGITGGLVATLGVKLVSAIKAAAAAWPMFVLNAQFVVGIFAQIPGGILAAVKALTALKLVTVAATVKQWALNAAMYANPIGLVVAALAALVAGFIMAYKHCDGFRSLVDRLTGAFKSLGKWIGKAWEEVKNFFGFGSSSNLTDDSVSAEVEELKKLESGAGIVVPAPKLDDVDSADLNTIGGLQQKIQELKEKQEKASLQNAISLQKEIDLYKEKLNLMQLLIAKGVAGNLADSKYKEIVKASDFTPLDVPSISIPVEFDKRTLERSWGIIREQLAKTKEEITITSEQLGSMLTNSIQSFFSSLGEAVASGNGLEILKSLLITVMGMLQQFGSALIAAGTASLALKAVAWNGVGAIIAGGALVAATAAAKAALQNAATPFAKGGIVSGPTYALVGEYSGASRNPEVIAPLDKLKTLIEPAAQPETSGEVRFVIRGETLEGILKKMNHKRSRTR